MTQAAQLAQMGSPGTSLGFKNRIINGDMRIDQRNAGASVSAGDGTFGVDRFLTITTAGAKFSMQQNQGSVTPPTGFTNYTGLTVTSAYSVGAGDTLALRHKVEGYHTADFSWGTANAQPITLSFWVRSSLTGTFAIGMWNSAQARSYTATYTINTPNTWEYKTITIPGDTTGTWLSTNGTGIGIDFSLGGGSNLFGTANSWNAGYKTHVSGATNVVGTNGATFYITGVQLEKGSVATPFEYRDYGRELQMCQRYFKWLPPLQGNFISGGASTFIAGLSSTTEFMRATPTFTIVNGSTAIHVSNVSTYNVTGFTDTDPNYVRVTTNGTAGAFASGHFFATKISLSSEL